MDDQIILRDTSIQADVPTVNNNIYTLEEMDKVIEFFNLLENKLYGELFELFDQFGYFGVANHISIKDSSHIVNDVYITDNGFFEAAIQIIDTSKGQSLKYYYQSGEYNIELFPRIKGYITQDRYVKVKDLTTFDVVVKENIY